MADDKHDEGTAPDPWAEILGEGAAEQQPEVSFPGDDVADAAAPESVLHASGTEPPAAAVSADDAGVDDALVDSWLEAGEPLAEPGEVGPLDEVAADSSSIEIGTGRSGIIAATEDGWDDVGPTDEEPNAGPEASEDTFAFGDPDAAGGSGSDAEGPAFAAAPAAAPARKPARPTKAKKSPLGQVVGVVLGGAMAIPITLGILIWGLQKDPFKVTKHVPENLAFLLPAKFQSAQKRSGAAVSASPLDALDAAVAPAGGDSAATASEDSAADAPSLPMDEPVTDELVGPVDDDVTAEPRAADESTVDPVAVTAPAAAVSPAAPPPLDTTGLDAAVVAAGDAVDALEAIADESDPARKRLLVDLYRSLAKVAEELVMLERVAADAGQPLAEPPRQLGELHGRIGRHVDDLVWLGRDWLDFSKRPSDGVVLPVTFQASRKVGPYWSSRVSLAMPKGPARELAVISRAEPSAVAGDTIVLTGMVFDGDVIWAADLRPLAAAAGVDFF